MGTQLPDLDDMRPLRHDEVAERLIAAFPEGTIFEFESGVLRMVVGHDKATGSCLTQALPFADGSMPSGPRLTTSSVVQILRQYGLYSGSTRKQRKDLR